MLLRLLPCSSPAQPTPPTILFTLPLPTHPFTSRSLPLPPNLLAHKSVCLHEDIDCSNVLLGEKSTWISGIIDDVTFSLPLQNVRIHYIDGSATTLPLDEGCSASLARVVEQVNMSFAPKQTTPASRPMSRASSGSSITSSSRPSSPTTPTPRRSTSALLLTLLSPLLPTSTSSTHPSRMQTSDPQYASRLHRRQARSLLVDTYRRYVLPELKETLPDAYLSWAIESEVVQRTIEYENLKLEINSLLASTGYDASNASTYHQFARRARSSTASTASSDASASASEYDSEQDTPPSSLHSSRCSSPQERLMTASPHTFLLAIPPAHELPSAYRSTYSHQLAELTRIASRLSSIKRLDVQYEREESKRRWLENLERGKAGERALRRAWSNGQSRVKHTSYHRPTRSSSLWRSCTAEDIRRQDMVASSYAIHPAMMEDDSDAEHDSVADSDSMVSVDEPMLVTPRKALFEMGIQCHSDPDNSAPQPLLGACTGPPPSRPKLVRKSLPVCETLMEVEHEQSPPYTTHSDESLSDAKPDQNHWDDDIEMSAGQDQDQDEDDDLLPKHKAFTLPPIPPRPEKWAALAPSPIVIPASLPTTTTTKTPGRGFGLKAKLVDWVKPDRERDRQVDQQRQQEELAILPVLF